MKIRVRKLKDLNAPIIQFANDAGVAEDTVDTDDSQYNRRAYVRALFAMIEGTVFFLKQTTFSTASSGGKCHLRVEEALMLQDSTVDLATGGKPQLKTKFIQLEDNLRFAVRMLNKVYNLKLDLKVGSKQWENFKNAITIRNRITHPKSIEDFVIDNEDLQKMREVRGWFCQFIADAVGGIVESIASRNNHIEETVEQPAI